MELPYNNIKKLKVGILIDTYLDHKKEGKAIILEIGEHKHTFLLNERKVPYYGILSERIEGFLKKPLTEKNSRGNEVPVSYFVGITRCKVCMSKDGFICWRNIPYLITKNPTETILKKWRS